MRVLSIFGGGHDSSATFVVDGKVERYLKEERYTGVKHASGYGGILKTLIDANLLSDVDYIMLTTRVDENEQNMLRNILRSFSPQVKFFAPVNEHHLFHASNAFYDSGFEESLVVVIDAAGSFFSRKHQSTLECESVYHARYPYVFKKLYKGYWSDGDFKSREIKKTSNGCLYQIRDISSGWGNIGNIYNTAALAMGQTLDDCGKAMGLKVHSTTIQTRSENAHESINLWDFCDNPTVAKALGGVF